MDLLNKFEADVVTAEKLTGGDMDILRSLVEGAGKRRIDYSDLGFGQPKPKKKRDDGACRQGSDIGQAVVYKRLGGRSSGGGRGGHRVVIEHRVRILEQPRRESMEEDMRAASTWFKCQQCGFTCTRINVIVWHNKAHLSKVCNYDSGIKLPGRRRRRPGAQRGGRDGRKKGKEQKGKENLDHSHTNGDVSGAAGGGKKDLQDTQQILMDWDDDEDPEAGEGEPGTPQSPRNKGGASDDGYSDADDYPPPQPRYERQPMPKAADLNSAFDALLAATHTQPNLNTSSGPANNYINNDSDSDYSDWEKYYARDSGSGSEDEEEVEQESDIKSLCEGKAGEEGAGASGIEEAGGSENSHEEPQKQEQEKVEPEKMEAASSPPRPVSAERVLSPAKEPVSLNHDLTPEPEPEQQQEECLPPTASDPPDMGDSHEEPLEVEEATEEVAEENMEMEEEIADPPEYCEEVTREPSPAEEELRMATEEVEYYEQPEKTDSSPLQIQAHQEVVTQEPVDLKVVRDYTEPCQDVLESAASPDTDVQESVIPSDSYPKSCDKERPENMNRLSRYIDEFSDTMVAKEKEVSTGTMGYSRGPRQVLEASSSPRPLHPGQEGQITGSPARPGDLAATSSTGTTYMLVAVDAHGNTVPTVPTPALSEGGSDLVAVEATMEDGTTRTLYIDPAQLGPNVDLSNLMLHIDTSGQEHVIIPSSSSSDSEGPSAHPAPPTHYSPDRGYGHRDYESAASPPEPNHSHVQHHGDSDS